MNTLTSNGTDNLPQAVLPPQPKAKTVTQPKEEPLFEEVEVIEENTQNNNLDQIAQRLKEESKSEEVVEKKKPTKKVLAKKVVAKKTTKTTKTAKTVKKVKSTTTKQYYVQVGSFSKYEPNKKFLKSITDKGFTYKYHRVTKNNRALNKVLVGPFNNEKNARSALRTIRSSIEAGAFLVRI
jgi:DedD protein